MMKVMLTLFCVLAAAVVVSIPAGAETCLGGPGPACGGSTCAPVAQLPASAGSNWAYARGFTQFCAPGEGYAYTLRMLNYSGVTIRQESGNSTGNASLFTSIGYCHDMLVRSVLYINVAGQGKVSQSEYVTC